MAKTVDARGLACPQPVLMTKKAFQEADEVTTIVDNEAARENVARLARHQGWQVTTEEKDSVTYLHLLKEAAQSEAETRTAAARTATGPVVVFIGADTIGRGSEELGGILMKAFVTTLGQVGPVPATVVFMNSGVKLVAEGSPVLGELKFLCDQGVELLACGTCLNYFKITDKLAAGRISNVVEIEERLFNAGRIVSL